MLKQKMTKKEYQKQYYQKNIEKLRERHRVYSKTYIPDPERRKEYERRRKRPPSFRDSQYNYLLKKKYGITLFQKLEMFEQQNGKCVICDYSLVDVYQASTDHNHITGEVRGLLCDACNIGLGCFKDNGLLLQNAIAYLDRVLLDKSNTNMKGGEENDLS